MIDPLTKVVNTLKTKFKITGIILTGSRARGNWTPWSDYDLLIIGEFPEDYLTRLSKILDVLSNISIEIEPHPYTLSETFEMLRRGNPIIFDALDEGIVLYETSGLRRLYNIFKELKARGMRRTNTSIIIPD